MFLALANLRHINSVTHEGKVLVFATDANGTVWYTVRRDGFEFKQASAASTSTPVTPETWENFSRLAFPDEKFSDEKEDDPSVVDREKATLRVLDAKGAVVKDAQGEDVYLMRSLYRTRTETTAVAPVQAVCGMGHVYVFRQSKSGTLLVDRFVLDGLTNTLRPKLEVRFKRSRQRYMPEKPASGAGRLVFDALNFRDADNKEFFEPTTELSRLNNLRDGWFSVVLLPTDEHDHFCWHIFAFNSATKKVELTTLAASDEGLFRVQDGRVPGMVHRTLAFPLEVNGAPVATKYDLQTEVHTKAGDQLLRAGTRVMLAVPTAAGVAVVDFAAAGDGTLSRVAERPETSDVLRGDVEAITLPLNTLDEIQAINDSASGSGGGSTTQTGAARGSITALARGDEDRLLLQARRDGAAPAEESKVSVQGTLRLDGLFRTHGITLGALAAAPAALAKRLRLSAPLSAPVAPGVRLKITSPGKASLVTTLEAAPMGQRFLDIEPTKLEAKRGAIVSMVDAFDIEHPQASTVLGAWQEVSETQAAVVFDGIVTAVTQLPNGKLRINAFNHGLEPDEEVQLTGMADYNGIWPIERIDGDNFLLDVKYQPGTAINLRLESRKRRGLIFSAGGGTISLRLDLPKTEATHEFWFRTRLPHAGLFQVVTTKPEATGPDRQIFLRGGELAARLGGEEIITANLQLADGQWHHVAHVHGASVKGQQLWVDGVLRVFGSQAASASAGETAAQLGFGDAPRQIAAFVGEMSELRSWKLVRLPQQIRQQMVLPLLGREAGLIGYWRLGAIVEGLPRKVVDFSPFENDGEVTGEVHLGGRTLRAKLRDDITPVTAYRNDELVAVTAGASYEESFEFQLLDAKSQFINPPRRALPPVFQFAWRGKRSRSSDEWIALSEEADSNGAVAARTLPFQSLGKGWFKATGKFTVPADSGIALMRTFFLHGVQSHLFTEMVIRQHRMLLISDAVTQESWVDPIPLPPLGTDSQVLDAALLRLAHNEREEVRVTQFIADTQRMLDAFNDVKKRDTALAQEQAQLDRLELQRANHENRVATELADFRNYKCRIAWRDLQPDGRSQERFLSAQVHVSPGNFVGGRGFLERQTEEQKAAVWWFTSIIDGSEIFKISTRGESNSAEVALILEAGRTLAGGHIVRLDAVESLKDQPSGKSSGWKLQFQPEGFAISVPSGGLHLRRSPVDSPQETLQMSEDSGAAASRWLLKKLAPEEIVGTRIDDARKVLQATLAEIATVKSRVDELQRSALLSQEDIDELNGQIGQGHGGLFRIQTEIQADNQTLLAASQPSALLMPRVSPDKLPLKTTAALLTFTRAASRLNLTETCEGNLQLAYFDPAGRMRLTHYDASNDSKNNASFEQWIQDKARLALNFKSPQAKVLLAQKIPLTDSAKNREDWTIEAWFFYDPTRVQAFSTLTRGADGDHQIIITDGQRLGWFQNTAAGGFWDSGYKLSDLATGWHHMAAVGKGQGAASTTVFYVDGKQVGDVKAHQLSLRQDELNLAKAEPDADIRGRRVKDAEAALQNTRLSDLRSRTDVVAIGNFQGGGQAFGKLAEVRIWGVALSDEEVEVNSRTTLTGNEPGLLAYYPFNGSTKNHAADKGPDGDNVGDAAEFCGCAAPIGHPDASVAHLPPVARDAVVSAEYVTYGGDPATGNRTAMMRRFFAMPTAGGITLLAQKRIEELNLLWIGNTQFKPTLLGYIEGAPPVPSENLTVDPTSYNGATSVELAIDEAVSYSWNREESNYRGNSVGGFVGLAWSFEASVLGVKAFETEGRVGFRGGQDVSSGTVNQTSAAASSGTSLTDKLELRGQPEDEAKFPHLGRRFIPKNVGYALVVSGLGDVFITQLKGSKRMVSYSVRPVDDIPLDVNTITFLINPAYTMNGSLDGLTGSAATSERFFPQVAQMRAQYGALYPASYYQLRDAYDRKAAIDKKDQDRAAYFASFKIDENDIGSGFDALPVIEGGKDAKSDDTKKTLDELRNKFDAQQVIHSRTAKAAWQQKMEALLQSAGKRNIVNTYVWDADGGLHAESQQFAAVIEHTVGGAFEADYQSGLDAEISAVVGVGIASELNYMHSQRMSQTLSKTESRSKGFALRVDLSGVEHLGITDFKDRPYQPGEKVDRYRFMTFYLEGDTSHFNDFFNEVVDPEWLAGNDEEARALREVDRSKANKTWRALHRVTYVERPALQSFGRDVRQFVEPATAASDLVSVKEAVLELKKENKQLQKKLDQIIASLGSADGKPQP